jgi:tetratricopeptide (TPR) repeat protein
MKIKLISSIFCIFSISIYFAQSKEAKKNSLTVTEVNQEAMISLENWNYFMRNNLDSLQLDAFRILMIGMESENDFAINVGKRSLGSYLIRTGKQDEGVKYLKQSKNYFEKRENLVLQTEILNEIGNGYLNMGKPIEAEKYYLQSLKCGKNSPDPTSSFLAEANLAQAYMSVRNLKKATGILHHYKKESLKKNKLESVSNAYALLGTIEQTNNNLPLAREYYRKSAEYGFRSKAKSQIGHAYNNMAIVYYQEDNLAASLDYFKKALEMRIKTKNSKSIAESYFNLGDYFSGTEQDSEALVYYKLAASYSKAKHLSKEEMDAVYAIYSVYKRDGNWELAIQNVENFTGLQEKYYSELSKKKTEDNELLETLGQLELKNNAATQEAKLLVIIDDQKYRTNILFAVAGFAIFALLILVIYKKRIN